MRSIIFMALGLVVFLFAIVDTRAIDPLTAAEEFWYEFASYCEWYPSKEHCDDGDMTLFNGLLCVSGSELGCDAVKAAQGADGRWWRSPRRVGHNLGSKNSFSRDMTLGVLLYLVKTRDVDAANRWLHWIKKNRACMLKKPKWLGGGCLQYSPFYRVCRDDRDNRCSITPNVWGLMYRVWKYLGLNPSSEMRDNKGNDGDWLAIEAKVTEPGYQLHLKGVTVLLKQYMNVSKVPRQELADILYKREPGNPFFVYLKYGPTQRVRDMVLNLCPARENGNNFRKHQWSWERETADRAWEESMGWDCIFMANLLNK